MRNIENSDGVKVILARPEITSTQTMTVDLRAKLEEGPTLPFSAFISNAKF